MSGSLIQPGALCAACSVEIVKDGEMFCIHTFHKKCIRRLCMLNKKSCPICHNGSGEIKYGDRSFVFVNFIESFMKPVITDYAWNHYWETHKDLHMQKFDDAFTCEDVDVTSNKNYQPYEKIGDSIITSFLVMEFFRRNPQTFNKAGVELNARNQICLSAGTHHAKMAVKNNFEPFITARYERWNNECEKLQILEDVFEAFIGAFIVVAEDFCNGAIFGISMCVANAILRELYKDVEMTISHSRMVDAKNRLKNLLEKNKYKTPTVENKYHTEVSAHYLENGDCEKITISTIYDSNRNVIGKGKASKKKEAERLAAENAISFLINNREYIEYVPAIYKTYC